MDEKALDALRNGLEDSHWYSDDDEKIFSELVIKAKAFDRIVEQRKETGVKTLGHYAWEIIREYESGDDNE